MDRPPPLRTDGSNAFARYSMQERVPRIARDVIEHNPDYPRAVRGAVERLARDIEGGAEIPAPRAPGPDIPDWLAAHAAHPGERWLDAEWFYAELAFYRELAHACRFWETGRDPFSPIKGEELAGPRPWERLEAVIRAAGDPAESRAEAVHRLLDACLWGNRVDLSYTVAAARTHRHDDDLLVDERDTAALLLVRPGAHVHVVADNTGTELALDLGLVDALLAEPDARVTVHLKMQPMFVSDALPADAWTLVDRMHARGGALGAVAARLQAAFTDGRLILAPDPFWNGPRFLWEAPRHLRAAFEAATIVVLKGDANYRRLVGDAPWPGATPLADVCAYLPSPLVALRTMKSDAVAGLPPGLAETLDASAPHWRIDGQRGVAQVYRPARTAAGVSRGAWRPLPLARPHG
ncbi:MAG: DUF89 family protein [Myxococcales bacterium]|nr:DUF89 family protein [Myxococcales bacterium]